MCVAMDERSEIVDAVNVFIPVHIPHPAPFAAGGVDGIRLHEHGGARVASRQARQRAIMHLPRSRFVVWIHSVHFSLKRPPGYSHFANATFCWTIRSSTGAMYRRNCSGFSLIGK